MDKIGENAELECVVFHVSPARNRYESVACTKSKTEVLVSGSLDQLAMHLSEVKKFQTNSSNGSFKLQRSGSLKTTWFTKSTVARFLHIVNSYALKSADAILNEISQLEDTKKFHAALHSKDQHCAAGNLTGDFTGTAEEAIVDGYSSEATKGELIRALELRLTALKGEMLVSLNQAADSDLSSKQLSDLVAFLQHFGRAESPLLKYLVLVSENRPSEASEPSPNDPQIRNEDMHDSCQIELQAECEASVAASCGVSPAKLAQVERQSSEGEESYESSDAEHAVIDRSRPLVRSGSQRRSASPMRRVQVGRSGSRRSPAIAIKSLSYFPAKDRVPGRDAGVNNGDEEETDQPAKKSESNVTRMSVQDAINLFESKQKDQTLDGHKKKAGGLFGTTKSVLRRWSAGMGESPLTNQPQEHSSGASSQSTSIDTIHNAEKKEMNITLNVAHSCQDAAEVATVQTDGRTETVPSSTPDDCQEPLDTQHEENGEKRILSSEWNHHKEAELNQMILKLMEGKPDGDLNDVGNEQKDNLSEKKGGFYSQYKEKRDAKLRAENTGKRTANEAQLKALQDRLEKSKAVVTPKSNSNVEKRSSSTPPQRATRNSSPPSLPKKDVSKAAASKKSSPKPSPTLASSWSSGSLTKATNTQKPRSSPARSSSLTPPSRQKTPTTSTPAANPSAGRPVQPVKTKKATSGGRPVMTEERTAKTVLKTTRVAKTKSSPASEEKLNVTAKPSLYNKVTKKSTVVPLETKPVRKAAGRIAPHASSTPKSKEPQPDDCLKDSEIIARSEDKESVPVAVDFTTKVLAVDLAQQTNDVEQNLEKQINNDLIIEKTEIPDSNLAATDSYFDSPTELISTEVPPDEDLGISSAAWVEVEHQEAPRLSQEKELPEIESPGIAPLSQSISPRIRHSLSQMLQAEVNDPEIIEWGNAEIPPALVFQKDSPKGLKRLLKFARKSKGDVMKGETNSNGVLSPPVVSDGEDEAEDMKGSAPKLGDVSSRKASLQGKGLNQQKSAFSETSDGGNASKRSLDGQKLSGEAHTSAGALSSSAKGTKSFFSLNFRSSKSSDIRLR